MEIKEETIVRRLCPLMMKEMWPKIEEKLGKVVLEFNFMEILWKIIYFRIIFG
jgi:hypothetical protein